MRALLHPPSYQANIPRFFVSRAISNAMLFLPVWVIFVQEKHGIDLVQVTLLDSAFWLTMALTEVPTGAVADTLGRKQSYAIGLGLSIAGVLLFGLAPTYGLVLFANSLWALALTFISGADLAFFYDTLRELDREAEFPRYRGTIAVVDIISTGISGVLGGLLYAWRPESPFILYAGLLGLSLFVALTFQEPPREDDPETGAPLLYRQVLRTAVKALREKPALRHVLAYSNLLPVAGAAIGITLIQPRSVEIGLPVAALGLVQLGINAARALGSGSAARLLARLGTWGMLVAAPVAAVSGVLGIGLVPGLAGLFVFGLASFSSAAARPLIDTLILNETPGSVRATILSLDSLIFRLLLAGISPLAGVIAESAGLPFAFSVLALGSGVLLTLNLGMWRASQRVDRC